MLDRFALKLFAPAIAIGARRLHAMGCNADQVTFAGFGVGLLGAALIAGGLTRAAIVALLVSRALDGLDGALARLCGTSDRGAFLDIGLDFVFYAVVPLAFAVAAPETNALAAATLLAAFTGTGATFLAYAIIAEKRGLKSTAYPTKSFYYLGGLAEGTETLICFLLMCLWPQHFAAIAYVYAAMCAVTIATRLVAGWRTFDGSPRD
jgi:phosphatidylglycerophosphate synthase